MLGKTFVPVKLVKATLIQPGAEEFGMKVLEKLEKYGAHMYGCPIVRVEPLTNGQIHLCSEGLRNGLPWTGKFQFQAHFVKDQHLLGSVDAVVETALQLLDKHHFLSKELKQGAPNVPA